MKTEGLEEKIKTIAGPVVEGFGLELVDLKFTTGHGRWTLQVFVDKPGGVTIDDCGDVSRELSTALDVDDPIPRSYTLEVSSPGLNRPLIKESDFTRFSGKKARIRTRTDIAGRRNFKATIDGADSGVVKITDADGRRYEIPLSNIEKANLEIEF